nr:D-arabinono-1,4-lactone oxidase [Kibdelosporangium sp. MJ126-NF4]CEL16237.1 FAD-dependent oxidoreductase [Kibdelosporangium sp. MJ126-NF4]CTQ94162.1 FAD-dependent oxidoreductase [Kibdelosporangium sp. MJ126-NF4]
MNTWKNWAGNQNAAPRISIDVRDTDDIVDAVTAAAQRGWRVKAAGSGHSFTGIAEPTHAHLRMHGHSGIVSIDNKTGRALVRGGTTLHDLNKALWEQGRALANLGDIDRQTITGAIATATHGTGERFGNLSTQVAAMDIVLADGALVTASPSETPELFEAAKVGLGALGVISTVTLETVPAFLLRSEQQAASLAETLEGLDETVASSDHFEFFWLPHTEVVYTKRNTRLALDEGTVGVEQSGDGLTDGELPPAAETALEALRGLVTAVPAAIPAVNQLITSLITPSVRTDWSYKVFATNRDARFVEMEYAVPREAVHAAFAELRAFVDRQGYRIPMPMEVRFTAADDVPLSTATGRATAYIAVHLLLDQDYDTMFRAVEPVLAAHDGRPHWGKIHFLSAGELAGRYPRFGDFVALRDKVDPSGRFGNPYLDRVLGTAPGAAQ